MLNRMFKGSAVKGVVLGLMVATGVASLAQADVASWQKGVVSLVAKKQVYPREAMSKEIEGRAKVRVTIDRSGKITGYEMVEKTGNAILDAEVEKMKDRINPLPAPPADLPDANLTFVLPLSWVLQ
ncbi:energy transducer TonB [Govanella unica]|uniref:TonB family protein n=1 Tax=Govanella unica TaxID=2975056 RepID=A0A9X3TZJ9_9PROT|nr:TonB family protein [Govania unica]MDA5194856.1 TonB family protein [Govania unica]